MKVTNAVKSGEKSKVRQNKAKYGKIKQSMAKYSKEWQNRAKRAQ